MATDDVRHKKFSESCPWLYGRGSTGHRKAAGSSVNFGVPSSKKQAFVAATITAGALKTKERLHAWRRGVEGSTGPEHLLRPVAMERQKFEIPEDPSQPLPERSPMDPI